MPPKNDKNDELIAQCLSQMRDLLTSELETFREQLLSLLCSSSTTGSPGNPQPGQHNAKTPKIKLLPFDGSNPLDWIFLAKHYFEYTQTPTMQRLTLIPFFMQGPALGWSNRCIRTTN